MIWRASWILVALVVACGAGGSDVVCADKDCSCDEAGIRAAIAEGGGPFTFDCDGPTTVVTEAEIVIDHDVILDGEGSLTVDGSEEHRVFSVATDITVELRRFTVTGGNTTEFGGGISSQGSLTLTSSTVSDNTASSGGGIRNEQGNLTLTNSTVSGNTASAGGGIFSWGNMTLTNSVVSDNTSRNGGGIVFQGNLTLTNSTVSGNTASADGGGIFSWGAEPPLTNSTVTLTNSTVSGNAAGVFGGGIHSGGSIVTLTNSTVSDNTAELGGGIQASAGTVTLANSLVEGDCGIVYIAIVVSSGYNIESPSDTCGLNDPTDQANVSTDDLKLGPLQGNGGPTETHALGAGSVAIDHIPAVDCEVTTDQRGEARPGGAMCDVGAFEVQP